MQLVQVRFTAVDYILQNKKKLLLSLIKELNAIENKPNFGFMFENRGILPQPIIVE